MRVSRRAIGCLQLGTQLYFGDVKVLTVVKTKVYAIGQQFDSAHLHHIKSLILLDYLQVKRRVNSRRFLFIEIFISRGMKGEMYGKESNCKTC